MQFFTPRRTFFWTASFVHFTGFYIAMLECHVLFSGLEMFFVNASKDVQQSDSLWMQPLQPKPLVVYLLRSKMDVPRLI